MLIRFPETDVRSMGRTAAGVKGISLGANDEVVGMEILEENEEILIVTKNGYGKRTTAEEYRIQSRGGKGIKTCNVTEKNGELIAVKTVTGEEEDLMLITAAGVLIRMEVEGISKTGRNTQGVKLIRLESADNEYVSTVAIVGREEEEKEEFVEQEEGIEQNPTSIDLVSDSNEVVENEEPEKDTEE